MKRLIQNAIVEEGLDDIQCREPAGAISRGESVS